MYNQFVTHTKKYVLTTELLGDNRDLVPLLPISNRTVKRVIADDSVVRPCESRTLPGSQYKPQ